MLGDGLTRSSTVPTWRTRFGFPAAAMGAGDMRLAEALGVVDSRSPENGQFTPDASHSSDILNRIQDSIDFDISPPKVNGPVYGLNFSGGCLIERHFDALYAAYRIRYLVEDDKPIYVIGAGAGYIALYCRRAGFSDFTILDLPTVSIFQYLVLASEFGSEFVRFQGEGRGIKLGAALNVDEVDFSRFGLVFNMDSMPEMPGQIVKRYLEKIRGAGMFLSNNQESGVVHGDFQQPVVRALAAGSFQTAYRFPCWLRMGYVEELYVPH